MSTLHYQIEFYTYWHAGSGLAGSTYADLLVNKDSRGLPYIPGRTLKGLLREAAEVIHGFNPNMITQSFILDVFGQTPTEQDFEEENATIEAQCFFSNAHLSEYLRNNIKSDQKSAIYHVLSSTRINEKGLAADGSLRQMEVTIPLTLFARVEQFPDKNGYEQQLQYCFKWIKRMGINRSRGLGRCQFSKIKN